jgi:hypothetical protein
MIIQLGKQVDIASKCMKPKYCEQRIFYKISVLQIVNSDMIFLNW